jgi:hypothetical protein
LLSIL